MKSFGKIKQNQPINRSKHLNHFEVCEIVKRRVDQKLVSIFTWHYSELRDSV